MFLLLSREQIYVVRKLHAERPSYSGLLPSGAEDYSLIHRFQTGYWGQPTSSSVRIGHFFPNDKAAGT